MLLVSFWMSTLTFGQLGQLLVEKLEELISPVLHLLQKGNNNLNCYYCYFLFVQFDTLQAIRFCLEYLKPELFLLIDQFSYFLEKAEFECKALPKYNLKQIYPQENYMLLYVKAVMETYTI